MSLFLVSWPCPQHFWRDSPSVIFPPAPISREVPSADILSISFPKPGNVKPQNLALACFAGRRGGEGGMSRRLAVFCRGSLRRGPAASIWELCAAFCTVGGAWQIAGGDVCDVGSVYLAYADSRPAALPGKYAPPNPIGGRHPGMLPANCVRPCAFPGAPVFWLCCGATLDALRPRLRCGGRRLPGCGFHGRRIGLLPWGIAAETIPPLLILTRVCLPRVWRLLRSGRRPCIPPLSCPGRFRAEG